ncbi:unnamed protein product [Eruca vesicaria subsp. sativa]|uniref:Uncharacterized protein n=1 Tax=Eruca vesicaria subsp. sativa TaxID=29727 RepID=A0ABC8KCF1_ERUVS|nr:unnamed protein product [Eruca vesicaria subsp. sativa]
MNSSSSCPSASFSVNFRCTYTTRSHTSPEATRRSPTRYTTRNRIEGLPASPSHTRGRLDKDNQNNRRNSQSLTQNLQWRVCRERSRSPQATEIVPPRDSAHTPTHASSGNRPPLERNLELNNFPTPPPQIPSTEEVMKDLCYVTFKYTNVDDPVERAARMQRVALGEEHNLMENTAASIIAAATSNLSNHEIETNQAPDDHHTLPELPLHIDSYHKSMPHQQDMVSLTRLPFITDLNQNINNIKSPQPAG